MVCSENRPVLMDLCSRIVCFNQRVVSWLNIPGIMARTTEIHIHYSLSLKKKVMIVWQFVKTILIFPECLSNVRIFFEHFFGRFKGWQISWFKNNIIFETCCPNIHLFQSNLIKSSFPHQKGTRRSKYYMLFWYDINLVFLWWIAQIMFS